MIPTVTGASSGMWPIPGRAARVAMRQQPHIVGRVCERDHAVLYTPYQQGWGFNPFQQRCWVHQYLLTHAVDDGDAYAARVSCPGSAGTAARSSSRNWRRLERSTSAA